MKNKKLSLLLLCALIMEPCRSSFQFPFVRHDSSTFGHARLPEEQQVRLTLKFGMDVKV